MEDYPGITITDRKGIPHIHVDGSEAAPKDVDEARKYYEDKKIQYTLTLKGIPEN